MHLHTVAGPHWQRRLWRTSIVNILIHRQACWFRRTLKGRLERFFPDENTVDIGFGEAALKRPGVKGWHSEEELSGVKSALMWYLLLETKLWMDKKRRRGSFKKQGTCILWLVSNNLGLSGFYCSRGLTNRKVLGCKKGRWGFHNEAWHTHKG